MVLVALCGCRCASTSVVLLQSMYDSTSCVPCVIFFHVMDSLPLWFLCQSRYQIWNSIALEQYLLTGEQRSGFSWQQQLNNGCFLWQWYTRHVKAILNGWSVIFDKCGIWILKAHSLACSPQISRVGRVYCPWALLNTMRSAEALSWGRNHSDVCNSRSMLPSALKEITNYIWSAEVLNAKLCKDTVKVKNVSLRSSSLIVNFFITVSGLADSNYVQSMTV